MLNLLPLPMLDGGRVFFILIEIVRGGKRVPPEKEALVHIAGFVDTGKVAHDWQDINPIDVKTSYGFGVRAATAQRLFLRCDVAFGGHEGPRVFLKFTPAF